MNYLEFMKHPQFVGNSFTGKSWAPWETFGRALFGLPFPNKAALKLFQESTGRTSPPSAPFRECFVVAGRRSGKSRTIAAIATFCAAMVDWSPYMSPGEQAVIPIIASTKLQSRVLLNYIKGNFAQSQTLRSMVRSELVDGLQLTNNVSIEIFAGDFRSVRGRSCPVILLDELAFFGPDGNSTPGALLDALRPSQIQFPSSLLLGISSPYAKSGVLFEEYKKHFGRDDSPTLVWKASSLTMNPSLSKLAIGAAYLRDPTAAKVEYGAEFHEGISSFVTAEQIDAVTIRGRRVNGRVAGVTYHGFCDPSGGRADAMVLCVAHVENGRAILDLIAERLPPFSPEQVTQEFAELLRHFGISTVEGDRYSAEWCSEQFQKRGIVYRACEKNRSELYLEILPSILSGAIELLDDDKLKTQFVGLERRAGRNGRDLIDHGVNCHDDTCNAATGALVAALANSMTFGVLDLAKKTGWDGFLSPKVEPTSHRKTEGQKNAEAMRRMLAKKPNFSPAPQPWKPDPPPPCERCGSVCVVRLGAAEHCNQCGADRYPNGLSVTVAGRDGVFLRKIH